MHLGLKIFGVDLTYRWRGGVIFSVELVDGVTAFKICLP